MRARRGAPAVLGLLLTLVEAIEAPPPGAMPRTTVPRQLPRPPSCFTELPP
ncbi:hypothetical protein OG728_37070 [Streptomyces microflavus]|uniref:hypothetical protein n=1 Tax=Streptomyces TaxID=1883 RepID=UPI0015C66A51|nr:MULTISPECIES: hypothetical protein [Streptomyces]WSR95690.1 hypothetical protein OG728_37070 [Streptomyces microflavus]